MLSKLAWSHRILFLLLILHSFDVCHTLTLFPPPPPIFLGSTQHITWKSIPGDPPFFGLSIKCFGTPPFPSKNCTTSKGELFLDLPGGFEIGVTIPCSLLALSTDTGQEIAPEANFDLILNDPTTSDLPGTKITVISQTHTSIPATSATPSPLTTEHGGNTSRENTGSTTILNVPTGSSSVTPSQNLSSITNGPSIGPIGSSTPQASFTSSSTSTAQTQVQTSAFPPLKAQKAVPLGAIIGGSIAGFLVLGVLLIATWVLCTRRRRQLFAPQVPDPLPYDSAYTQPLSSRGNRSVHDTLLEKAERQRREAIQNTPTSNPEFFESATIMSESSSTSDGSQEARLRNMVQHMSERLQTLEASRRRGPAVQRVWLQQPPPNYSDGGHGRSPNTPRQLPLIPGPPVDSTSLPVHPRTSLVGTNVDAVGTEHHASAEPTYNDNSD